MIINLSEAASNAMLDVLAGMMDGGSIQLLDAGKVLAVLKLSNPAAKDADSGELVFNRIAEEHAALAQGNALSARVIAKDGSEVFSCDVGDENSDAVIKLKGTTKIHSGQTVRLNSFRMGWGGNGRTV
jgi:hypothetical protein